MEHKNIYSSAPNTTKQYPNQEHITEDNNTDGKLKILTSTIAFIFLSTGLYVFYVLVSELLKIFTHMESNECISKITQTLSNKELLISNEQPIILGEGAASIIAHFFLLLLASCLGRIAYLLTKSGVRLLSPQIEKDIETIKENIKSTKENMKTFVDNTLNK